MRGRKGKVRFGMNKLCKIMLRTISSMLIGTSLIAVCWSSTVYAAAPPQVAAQGAVVYNVNTGEFLYEKNGDVQFYPASITKIMTALLTLENANMDDTVVFSRTATTNMESGAVTLGVGAGDRISVRDSLYGMMLKSANEVANGLAEHVGGSIPGFASMMNARAREIGAKNTNFVNPSGLNNANHLTTAKDMALIAAEAFKNPEFRKIVGTTSYTFPATESRPSPTAIGMGHKMIYANDNRYYPGVIGGKTGYTKSAGNTLVTGAQRNGVTLVVVVLKCPATHYADTKALLDYGFETAAVNNKDISKDTNEIKSTTDKSQSTNELSVESPVEETKSRPLAGSQEWGENTTSYGPGMKLSVGWKANGEKWVFLKENSIPAKDEVLDIKGKRYWFDSDEYMAVGWRQDNKGNWYYMESSGAMDFSSWINYNGLWYYVGSDGKMLTNTTTPDGYYVNGDGVWVS